VILNRNTQLWDYVDIEQKKLGSANVMMFKYMNIDYVLDNEDP
jgi:hypothetical protein